MGALSNSLDISAGICALDAALRWVLQAGRLETRDGNLLVNKSVNYHNAIVSWCFLRAQSMGTPARRSWLL
jgi:hypothetical protein